jgi:hypothetical protein
VGVRDHVPAAYAPQHRLCGAKQYPSRFDLSTQLIEAKSLFMRYVRVALSTISETWHFGIDRTPAVRRVAAFLESRGL